MTVTEQNGYMLVIVSDRVEGRLSPMELAKNAGRLLHAANTARANHKSTVDLACVGFPGTLLDPAEACEWALAWFRAAAEAVANQCSVVQPDALVA